MQPTFPERPQRIASLLSSATEMLYGLGLGEQVVGVSHECDFPPDVRHKPRLTFTRIAVEAASGDIDRQVRELSAAGQPLYEIDVERLAALEPDLIVTQAQCDVCAVRYEDVLAAVRDTPALRGTRVVPLNPATLDDIFADIARLGAATGYEAAAQQLLARLRQRVAAVQQRTAALTDAQRPRVGCIEWIEPLMVAANWTPQLVELAGGRQSLAEAGRHSGYTAWDELLAMDPEVLVVMPCGFDLPRTIAESATLTSKPGWRDMSAVRASRVLAVDGNAYFNRSGPRIVDSLEILARLVQPGLFNLRGDEAGENGVWQRLS